MSQSSKLVCKNRWKLYGTKTKDFSKELKGGEDTISASSKISDIADRVLTAARPFSVVDGQGKTIGALEPQTVIRILTDQDN